MPARSHPWRYTLLKSGQIVGQYEIERHLGDGGFASVYSARHLLLDSRHAVKVLASELVQTPDLRARFLTEGRLLAALRHPGIVRVTDLIAEPGVAALVMDLVEGPTLEKYLKTLPGGHPAPAVMRWFLPLLRAVAVAHEAGVVHRDLKPSNVVLTSRTNGGALPVVLDFGIAKIASATPGFPKRTLTGSYLGTPGYMSPEQINRPSEVDHRTDIFSLGVILVEALTGRRPFDRETDFETMRATVDLAVDLDAVPSQIRVVAAGMLKAVDQRLPSCRDVERVLLNAGAHDGRHHASDSGDEDDLSSHLVPLTPAPSAVRSEAAKRANPTSSDPHAARLNAQLTRASDAVRRVEDVNHQIRTQGRAPVREVDRSATADRGATPPLVPRGPRKDVSEFVYYELGAVRVTNIRFQVHGGTYPMSQVTSVRACRQPAQLGSAIVLFLTALASTMFWCLIYGSGLDLLCLVVSGSFGFMAFVAMYVGRARHYVELGTASGVHKAHFAARDTVDEIVAALNDAIVARG
jgi:serine/threonine protein kinase